MPAYYRIVQYLPDAIIDERINIGVIAYDEHQIQTRFLSDWRRVQSFGGKSISFLKDFASEIAEATSLNLSLPNLPGNVRLNEAILEDMSKNWANSIQVTSPKGSLLEREELLRSVSARFLRERVVEARKFRPRTTAAGLANQFVADAIRARYGASEIDHFLSRSMLVSGRLEPHQIDVSVGNGQLVAVAQGLSFEGPDTPERSDNITKTAYALEDILRRHESAVQATVVVLPPFNRSKDYERAIALFPKINAQVVDEDDIPDWAGQVVQKLPPPEPRLQSV